MFMTKTSQQYNSVITSCREIFTKKMKDYGSAWRVLRTSSITDQIYIKGQRIRTIEEKKQQKVQEDIRSEYIGIINYAIIGLIQLELGQGDSPDLNTENAMKYFQKFTSDSKSLMENKNHDYGEAWRDMRISSLTDLILVKILRIKQIEDNKGETLISEGIDANYFDIINYAVFALIRIEEN